MRTQQAIETHITIIENDEIPEEEHPNEKNSEGSKTNKTSAIPKFMP